MGKVKKTKENLKKCACIKCPSYTLMCKMKGIPANVSAMVKGLEKAEHMEGMFCAFDKSKCIEKEEGCICGSCPIYKENNLDKYYYCTAKNGK